MEALKAEAKRRGLWALGHPKEIGGGGLPFMDVRATSTRSSAAPLYGQVARRHVVDAGLDHAPDLYAHRGPEGARGWLRSSPVRSVPSIGMTEPEVAGSDPTQHRRRRACSTATSGSSTRHKWFTTGANIAAFTTVFCRHRSRRRPTGTSGSQLIIVPTDTPGYELVRGRPDDGLHAVGRTARSAYDDVRVPASNLLGTRGEGFTIAQQRLGPGRIFHCMRWLGQAQRAFELMCERANDRVRARVARSPTRVQIQRMIFDSAADIQSHRLMVLDAARMLDQWRCRARRDRLDRRCVVRRCCTT